MSSIKSYCGQTAHPPATTPMNLPSTFASGENGNFRKPRHPLILVIQHLERAKPLGEGNLLLLCSIC